MARFFFSFVSLFLILQFAIANRKWTFGEDILGSQEVFVESGVIKIWEKTKEVRVNVPTCMELVYVDVNVNNILATPDVRFDRDTRVVTISYSLLQSSLSSYEVAGRAVFIAADLCPAYLQKVNSGASVSVMHPLRERACDELLENPALRTPPPEPERPRPPRVRKPREFKLPPRFPLLSKEFYACWCNHQKELQMSKAKVDDHPPELFPELYLKPRRLDYYARQLEENMNVNKELLKRINLIQRTGGFVDCWMRPEPTNTYNKLLCQQRQRQLDEIRKANLYFYSRLLIARSEQLLTKELGELWKDTKHKLILGASLPFILFKTEKIDRDIRDPAFDKPLSVHRTKVAMEIWVIGGSKIGKVTIELFNDLVPKTCQLFLTLVRGDAFGHAYTGSRIFRVVPDLYCRCGDVTKDNGFGCYLPEGETEPMGAESYSLKHSVPGVLSMVVTSDNEVCGQFNIIFKPLPQFDRKHVVFGRIVGGPAQALERISALGLPLGTTSSDCVIRSCGWFTRTNAYREGNPNTIKFPPRRRDKK